MEFDNIEKFIELAKKNGLKELKYETDEMKISVSMPHTGEVVQAQARVNSASQHTQVAGLPAQESEFSEICSPFVGTFYRSSSPQADPYIKKGQKISKGQVLCIVEAMKIMNEIESEVDGEVVEICAENENYVEFGQVLFKIKPL